MIINTAIRDNGEYLEAFFWCDGELNCYSFREGYNVANLNYYRKCTKAVNYNDTGSIVLFNSLQNQAKTDNVSFKLVKRLKIK